mgnify:CR=1 FL=1
MVGGSAIAELLIKVIGKENLICFEVPLKYDIISSLLSVQATTRLRSCTTERLLKVR